MIAFENTHILKNGDEMRGWDKFVANSPQGCIFCSSWWLDAVCPGSYQILVFMNGASIVAGIPMFRSQRWGFDAIHMPPLTQTLGVLYAAPSGGNYEKNLSDEMKIANEIIKAIPKTSVFNVQFHRNFTNWLPFYWAGYRQTTLYSYVFDDLSDLAAIFDGFDHSKRKNLKKASGLVEVRADLPPDRFYANHSLTLQKQKRRIAYSSELFQRLHQAAYDRGAGKTWYAVDKEDNLHAAIFVVFDAKCAYYLISTIDPDYRNSGAATLLVKTAIEYLATRTRRFDFEGSMIEGVEASFRRFGARQVPYSSITRWSKRMSYLRDIQQAFGSLDRRHSSQ